MDETFGPYGSLGLLDAIKRFEGFSGKPYQDYGQYASGFGTRARPGEGPIDRNTAEERLKEELAPAAKFVDLQVPNLPPGVRDAMISLTYNTGGKWADSGLGKALKTGDYDTAKQLFAQYNKAGGQPLEGLTKRRAEELSWFDKSGADNSNSAVGYSPGNKRMASGLLGSLGYGGEDTGSGGLFGALKDPERFAGLAMIAKGLSPYSDIDPTALLKLAQAQKEHAVNQQFRQMQLDLSRRAQDRADMESERPQYMTRPDGSIVAIPRQGGSPQELMPAIKNVGTEATKAADDMGLQPGTPEYKDFITRWYQKKIQGEDKPIPAEVSGRLALADTYLKKAPQIATEIDKGTTTGPVDVLAGRLGVGKQGMVHGDIQSGVDALRRMLTGAGMPAAEANEYVKRYEPTFTDSKETMRYKHDRLVEELTGMRDNIMRGRGPSPSPSSQDKGGARDSAGTLNDAREAIQRGAPRDKVIQRLRQMGVDPAGL